MARNDMTREEAIKNIKEHCYFANLIPQAKEALDMAIQALSQEQTVQDKQAESEKYQKAFDDGYANGYEQARFDYKQEPCELLIIKSDILLHQDDRKKWMESIKREKESGVIILPPYFEPLLVPNDIEISIEQEPKTGHWLRTGEVDVYYDLPAYECDKCGQHSLENGDYCPNCGARMVEPQESEDKE